MLSFLSYSPYECYSLFPVLPFVRLLFPLSSTVADVGFALICYRTLCSGCSASKIFGATFFGVGCCCSFSTKWAQLKNIDFGLCDVPVRSHFRYSNENRLIFHSVLFGFLARISARLSDFMFVSLCSLFICCCSGAKRFFGGARTLFGAKSLFHRLYLSDMAWLCARIWGLGCVLAQLKLEVCSAVTAFIICLFGYFLNHVTYSVHIQHEHTA